VVSSGKTANRITQAQQKAPKPKDDTQIPRPDLRFAIKRKQRRKTKKRGQSPNKPPRTTQDLPSDTGGMSDRVIKNMHCELIKIFIYETV
jgi:hypothetical protein